MLNSFRLAFPRGAWERENENQPVGVEALAGGPAARPLMGRQPLPAKASTPTF